MVDVVIAGGGPAGLNAALMLGRARRNVLLADAGEPRNAPAAAVHGFLSRDGHSPAILRDVGREELSTYPSVRISDTTVTSASAGDKGFEVTLAGGETEQAQRLLLACGVVDDLPSIDGLAELWGKGVFHCPYCHGWEVRDRPVIVLGGDDDAAHLAVHLTRFSKDVVLCSNGPSTASPEQRKTLKAGGIRIYDEPIVSVEGIPDRYVRAHFLSGWSMERYALFVKPGMRQKSDLAAQLGCTILEDGAVQVNEFAQTTVPGVFAAGDMCRTPAMPFPAAQVVMAAAAGALAAVVIDQELLLIDAYEGAPTDEENQA
jgi:thioredoxin reductase